MSAAGRADGRSPRRAVVLLSGGLDSATALAIARAQGYETVAVTIDYGQRHAREIAAAEHVARAFECREHLVLRVDLRPVGGSALTAPIPVPKGRAEAAIGVGIPVTYVPARNTIFLSLALAVAETRDAGTIFVGVNALDYSGYPDCRPEFLGAFERVAELGTRRGTEERKPFAIEAPLLRMSKADIIRKGIELGVDYAMTWSCYDPDTAGRPCGLCDACLLRAKGFAEAGVPDPLLV